MKPSTTIRVGYEVGSGAPVDIPLGHLAVTGQTQQSGKTTTLEALVYRSGRKAIAFRTKLGEQAFSGYKFQPAFFTERADWQFVSSILEATLREKLKFERSWIMRVCKGAKTLGDVRDNVHEALKTAKGLNQDIYYRLSEYLDLVVPQLERLPDVGSEWLDANLVTGVNVMDLGKYSSELQALVIRSVLQWVHDTQRETIIVIPEAWEFIPEDRGSPVKLAAEHLIRKGAAVGNYVWLDSQDIAGVDAVTRKAVSVWIMGVQRADVEVKRVLAHLPAGAAKPKPADVMQLGVGEFFVSHGRELKRVYVQPAWMDAEKARLISRGEYSWTPRDMSQVRETEQKRVESMVQQEELSREIARGDRLAGEIEQLKAVIADLRQQLTNRNAIASHAPDKTIGQQQEQPTSKDAPLLAESLADSGLVPVAPENFASFYFWLRARLLQDPEVLRVATSRKEIDVTVERHVISMTDSTVQGAIALLISEHFFKNPSGAGDVARELARRGRGNALPNICKALDKITGMGFLRVDGRKGERRYCEVSEMKVNVVAA